MKANELRIGNLVILKKDFYTYRKGNIFKLSNVGIDYLDRWQDMGASDNLRITDVEPIPLTEEWLVKLGFYKINESEYRHTEYFYNFKKGWFGICEGVGMEIVFDMKHVHSLQNLYFALTGEELQCKE